MAKVKSELEGSCRLRWDTTIQRIKPPPWHWPIVRTRTWNWLNRRRGFEKKNGGKSWKLWWYPIQVIKPPPWHWPIVLPGHLVSGLWTWGEKQKIENGTHWYARIKLNGKLIILGNVAQWQERKIFWRSRTCSRRVGKDYRTLWLSGPDTQDHTLAYFFG